MPYRRMDELREARTILSGYVRIRTEDCCRRAYSVSIASSSDRAFITIRKEIIMNKDQVEGKLQDIGGKIQEEAGKLVGNTEQEAKGLKNQVEGKTQEKYGDVKQKLNDATE
jgi:uncharacterized protein YjbJ (UPF0337 family)